MDGYLCLPGGHVEKGETPTIAIIREIQEELGVTVAEQDLEFLSVVPRNVAPIEHFSFEFIIKDKDYTYKNNEPEKCSELVWADIDNLPDDVVDDFRYIIEQSSLYKKPYLEIGYDT